MKQPPIVLKTIKQIDNHLFSIEWSDGISKNYRLADLQEHCPCALCYNVETQSRRSTADVIDPNVKAKEIKSVGRYALKIAFTSGCSKGIYSYSLLYQWK